MPRKGKSMPKAQRERMRQVALARWAGGQLNPMQGRRHSPETRAKMAEARRQFYAQLSPEERKALGIRVLVGRAAAKAARGAHDQPA